MPAPSTPTLSVVMTNYNHGHYLPEALRAILTQSRPPDEFIIVDDASTDNSRTIIASFAAKYPCVRPIYNEKNCGAVPNANNALNMATGRYVYFGAADDRVLPGFFEAAMKLAEEYPDVGCICCDPVWCNEGSNEMWITPLPLGKDIRHLTGAEIAALHKSKNIPVVGHATIYRRTVAIEAGGFIAPLKGLSDWLLIVVVAFRHGLCYIPKPLAFARLSPNSFSGAQTRSWESQRSSLQAMMELLNTSAYSDVLSTIIDSESLAGLGGFARFVRENDSFAHILTPAARRKIFVASLRHNISRAVPFSCRKVVRKALSEIVAFKPHNL